jgi:hypothetical protein
MAAAQFVTLPVSEKESMSNPSFSSKCSTIFLTVALSAAVVANAGAQRVSTDYDHQADFQRYHTFTIFKLQASNSLVEQRLRDALMRDLTSRGLQMVPQGGDLAVTAIGSRKSQQEYNTFYDGLGGGFGWRGRGFGGGFGGNGITSTQVVNIPVGTLVVDLYDGSKHQLLFRGVASDTLSSKEEKNSKKLQKAVDKIFEKFPPKTAS